PLLPPHLRPTLLPYTTLFRSPDYKPLAIETSEVRCPDEAATEAMKVAIDRAKEAGESLGGTFRVVATGLVPGVGGYATAGDRLTDRKSTRLNSSHVSISYAVF